MDRYFENTYVGDVDWRSRAFIDDGSIINYDKIIHPISFPPRDPALEYRMPEISILHYQYCEQQRMSSRHRWYRCFERLSFPEKSDSEINRYYSWMLGRKRTSEIPQDWFRCYEEEGINMTTIRVDGSYWWDWDVLRFFHDHGTSAFRGLDVWDYDWETSRQSGIEQGLDRMPKTPIRNSQRWIDCVLIWASRCYHFRPIKTVVILLVRIKHLIFRSDLKGRLRLQKAR